MDQEETSTTSEHITTDKLFQNETVSILNMSSVPVVTTTVNTIPNSTDTLVTAAGKNINGKVVNTTHYSYYTSASSSDSGLSGGAIAGIVIGVIVLLCCCGAFGCCKSGHWETRDVWIEHFQHFFNFVFYLILNFMYAKVQISFHLVLYSFL